VVEEEVQGEASFRSLHGLITISDLNRQPFRNMLYGLLAEVEAGLAGLWRRGAKIHGNGSRSYPRTSRLSFWLLGAFKT
jgi:hypothetical protein